MQICITLLALIDFRKSYLFLNQVKTGNSGNTSLDSASWFNISTLFYLVCPISAVPHILALPVIVFSITKLTLDYLVNKRYLLQLHAENFTENLNILRADGSEKARDDRSLFEKIKAHLIVLSRLVKHALPRPYLWPFAIKPVFTQICSVLYNVCKRFLALLLRLILVLYFTYHKQLTSLCRNYYHHLLLAALALISIQQLAFYFLYTQAVSALSIAFIGGVVSHYILDIRIFGYRLIPNSILYYAIMASDRLRFLQIFAEKANILTTLGCISTVFQSIATDSAFLMKPLMIYVLKPFLNILEFLINKAQMYIPDNSITPVVANYINFIKTDFIDIYVDLTKDSQEIPANANLFTENLQSTFHELVAYHSLPTNPDLEFNIFDMTSTSTTVSNVERVFSLIEEANKKGRCIGKLRSIMSADNFFAEYRDKTDDELFQAVKERLVNIAKDPAELSGYNSLNFENLNIESMTKSLWFGLEKRLEDRSNIDQVIDKVVLLSSKSMACTAGYINAQAEVLSSELFKNHDIISYFHQRRALMRMTQVQQVIALHKNRFVATQLLDADYFDALKNDPINAVSQTNLSSSRVSFDIACTISGRKLSRSMKFFGEDDDLSTLTLFQGITYADPQWAVTDSILTSQISRDGTSEAIKYFAGCYKDACMSPTELSATKDSRQRLHLTWAEYLNDKMGFGKLISVDNENGRIIRHNEYLNLLDNQITDAEERKAMLGGFTLSQLQSLYNLCSNTIAKLKIRYEINRLNQLKNELENSITIYEDFEAEYLEKIEEVKEQFRRSFATWPKNIDFKKFLSDSLEGGGLSEEIREHLLEHLSSNKLSIELLGVLKSRDDSTGDREYSLSSALDALENLKGFVDINKYRINYMSDSSDIYTIDTCEIKVNEEFVKVVMLKNNLLSFKKTSKYELSDSNGSRNHDIFSLWSNGLRFYGAMTMNILLAK